jgi:16S rRNA (guanine966-N2)-methyltransferase
MRIVGGRVGGRTLAAPDNSDSRPTTDRVRESIFNVLAHGIAGFSFENVRVLDAFAGTGALGLEALSRGGAYCLFIEHDAAARGLIRRNVESLGLTGVTKVFRRDATDLGPARPHGTFALAFLDPPYGQAMATAALASMASGGWLAEGAVIVIEDRRGSAQALPPPFALLDRRTWGDTEAVFARFQSAQQG